MKEEEKEKSNANLDPTTYARGKNEEGQKMIRKKKGEVRERKNCCQIWTKRVTARSNGKRTASPHVSLLHPPLPFPPAPPHETVEKGEKERWTQRKTTGKVFPFPPPPTIPRPLLQEF